MSSDPKKPGLDAPPQGTPELLQKDLALDRRRRVPSFEELQAPRPPPAGGPDVPTDPMRPAMHRPIPNATVPARPSNLEEVTTQQRAVPPGLQARQPVVPIRTPTPPTQPMRVAIPPPPPAPRAPMPPPQRTMTPGPAPRAAAPAAAPQAVPTQPVRPPQEPRPQPPSPTEFAQHRPSPVAMPQVTPSVPAQGALRPEGQPALRSSQPGLKPAPPPPAPLPPRAVVDEPEPRTAPAAPAAPRTFTPAPMPPPRQPNQLPAELLVTQPGLPGPFAQARAMPQNPAIPQRPPSLPELPRAHAPDSGQQPAHDAAPQFEDAHFEAAPGEASDTVTAEPAALWRRLGAWLTDLIFVGTLVLGLLVVATQVIAPQNLTPLQQLMAIALPGAALAAILAFVYTTLFAFLWAGRTPGRRLMGIRLVTVTGHSPGPARALLRAALSLVSFALCLSGFWLALFDRHGQTLHDKLTRTFVVKLQDA